MLVSASAEGAEGQVEVLPALCCRTKLPCEGERGEVLP